MSQSESVPRSERLCVTKAEKKGHFSKICRSVGISATIFTNSYSLMTTTLPSLHYLATVYILIGKNETTALIEIVRPGSFISLDYAKRHQIKIKSAVGNVSIDSSPP